MKFTNSSFSESEDNRFAGQGIESGQYVPSPSESLCNRSMVVFDIGGTWVRSAIFREPEQLSEIRREPAPNFKNMVVPSGSDLHAIFCQQLLNETNRLLESQVVDKVVVVSLGAALNAKTGEVYQSGPLWGPNSDGIPLKDILYESRPDVQWIIVNDVTAALFRYIAKRPNRDHGKTVLITVGSGIACRTFDEGSNRIPSDRATGLQGEIGHTTIDFNFRDVPVHLQCDCGGIDHLNAFCSGRGIEQLVRTLSKHLPETFAASQLSYLSGGIPDVLAFEDFRTAIVNSDSFAISMLDAVTLPIARYIVTMLTLDPDINRIILTGGVVHSVEDTYLESLNGNLSSIGMYQITNRDPEYFVKRIEVGYPDDNSGLIGAGHYGLLYASWLQEPSQKSIVARTVKSQLRVTYSIRSTKNLLQIDNPLLFQQVNRVNTNLSRCLVIVDAGVHEHYGIEIATYFHHYDLAHTYVVLQTSEQNKSMDTLNQFIGILNEFAPKRRSEPIIAFGGGVLLDIVGFGVSIFRRGLQYIRIPTTLLGLVDAGIGAKTGVSYSKGKNRLGTFYPPALVILDKGFIRTLDNRHIINGMAEIAKIAIAKDPDLFRALEKHSQRLILDKFQSDGPSDEVISRSVQLMLDELEPNLWESDLCRVVDFGHTFSPKIELYSPTSLLHGEAVSIDMALSTIIAHNRQLISDEEKNRIIALLQYIGLPVADTSCNPILLTEALHEASLHRDGKQRLPLPVKIGTVNFFDDIASSDLILAISTLEGSLTSQC